MTPGGHYRRRGYRYPYPYPVNLASDYPVAVANAGTGCTCDTGADSGDISQKIKENPLVFVVGALLVGYLLAKKK